MSMDHAACFSELDSGKHMNRLHPPTVRARHAKARGVTLVEILVSMVLGLVVIGVVLSNYLTSGLGKNSSSALQQMTEDATVALNFIRKQVSTAGYSSINPTTGSRAFNGAALRGCNGLFATPLAELSAAAGLCDATAGTHSIAVAYEADVDNAVATATNLPRDCIGTGVAPNFPAPPAIPATTFVESRLYLNGTDLMCQGNGLSAAGVRLAPQPVVSNIVDMQITYGAAPAGAAPATSETAYPATPNTLSNAAGVTDWTRVVAVRVCIVVRSENEVFSTATPYYGCNAITDATPATTTPPDRRMYRAFSTTIMVQNNHF